MGRKQVTYSLFAGGAGLVALALALVPRTATPTPPPPNPPPPTPPPIIAVQPDPPLPPPVVQQQERPRIEVMFALDTTGSMEGLIDGAKRKIWSIADFIASGNPRPEVRVGLVGYRDIGDEYVTRFYDLSDDMDTVFQHLQSFRADGGGDTPEHVARALHDAVDRASWTQGDDKVVKIIYLVGDAPPHTDYHDGYDYRSLTRKAAKLGIHVNTVRCGDDFETATVWREIARLGHGEYASIEQSGGVAVVRTPYDERMAELNRKLAGTAIGYGAHRGEVAAKIAAAAAAPAPMAADRAAFSAKNGWAVSGGGDLADDVANKRVDLDKVKSTDLPAEMQGMPAAVQKAYVEKKLVERQRVMDEINRLSSERSAFLKKEAHAAPRRDGFDDTVRKAIVEESKSVTTY